MDTINVPVLPIGTPTDKNVVYPLEVVQRAIEDARTKKFVCQMMMPTSLEFGHSVMVNASHVVESLYILDNVLHAELRILDTEYGQLLKQMREKIEVKFSIAALGDAEQREDGYLEAKSMKIIGVHVAR